MEPEQRRTWRFVTTFMRAYAISSGGATRCNRAAPAVSQKERCSANWEYCRFAEPIWSPVRESAVKPVGKPGALIWHVRFDERGWETGRRSASALAPILDSTNLAKERLRPQIATMRIGWS